MAPHLKSSALICVSHLRWDFVYQRPQHLLSRVAREREVVYFEEPRYCGSKVATLEISQPLPGLTRIIPLLPDEIDPLKAQEVQARLLERYVKTTEMTRYDLWYYTPMGTRVTKYLNPEVVIFDCMDELSAFLGAPPELRDLEQALLRRADVVFTGGASLFESKCLQHSNVHCCPSSIDAQHFAKALQGMDAPADQQGIPNPRVGFYGVLDERLDAALLSQLAQLRPDLHFVIIGPIVKIDAASLPQAPNIHYLGKREYEELPSYLSSWNVAMLPFARNAATRFISPTKTPEYLAAGCPVVSTSIQDVVRPYGELGLISIADTPEEFSRAIDFELSRAKDPIWREKVKNLSSKTSWDNTWSYMSSAIETVRGSSDVTSPVSMPLSTSSGTMLSTS